MQQFNYWLLREKRIEKLGSMQNMAMKLHDLGFDVSPTSIWKYEMGETVMDADALPYFAKALDMQVEDFYVQKEEEPKEKR